MKRVSSKSMEKPLVKGLFVKSFVAEIRQNLDPQSIKALEQKFNDLQFSAVKEYESTTFFALQDAAREKLFPNLTPDDQWRQIGKLTCKTFFENPIGKTFLALIGNDVPAIAKAFPGAIAMMTKNIDASVPQAKEGDIVIEVKNIVQPAQYFEGLFLEAFDRLTKVRPNVKIDTSPCNDNTWTYTYHFNW